MNTHDPAADTRPPALPAPPAARVAYALSLLLFVGYLLDVVVGKASVVLTGARLPWHLGDFGEFLVVLAMSVAFVAGLMLSETSSDPAKTGPER